jgi:hypothetical protein
MTQRPGHPDIGAKEIDWDARACRQFPAGTFLIRPGLLSPDCNSPAVIGLRRKLADSGALRSSIRRRSAFGELTNAPPRAS